MSGVLASPSNVIQSLVRYTDWWQPATTSILLVGGARRSSTITDGISLGLLERLDERTELRRCMRFLAERDRRLLYLWYVEQLPAADIAQNLKISRRQCFRRRASAIRQIVECAEDGVG